MVQIKGSVYFLAALLLLMLPLNWVISVILAALIHELCHLAVLWLWGGRIRGIQIDLRGCEIRTDTMDFPGQFISVLAGPAGSLSLLLLSSVFPRLALCGVFHGLYNLIPVLPLDGGRMLQIILCRYCPEWADRIHFHIRNLVYIAVLAAALGISLLCGNILPVILAVFWIIRVPQRKIPCKPSQIGVQ